MSWLIKLGTSSPSEIQAWSGVALVFLTLGLMVATIAYTVATFKMAHFLDRDLRFRSRPLLTVGNVRCTHTGKDTVVTIDLRPNNGHALIRFFDARANVVVQHDLPENKEVVRMQSEVPEEILLIDSTKTYRAAVVGHRNWVDWCAVVEFDDVAGNRRYLQCFISGFGGQPPTEIALLEMVVPTTKWGERRAENRIRNAMKEFWKKMKYIS